MIETQWFTISESGLQTVLFFLFCIGFLVFRYFGERLVRDKEIVRLRTKLEVYEPEEKQAPKAKRTSIHPELPFH